MQILIFEIYVFTSSKDYYCFVCLKKKWYFGVIHWSNKIKTFGPDLESFVVLDCHIANKWQNIGLDFMLLALRQKIPL